MNRLASSLLCLLTGYRWVWGPLFVAVLGVGLLRLEPSAPGHPLGALWRWNVDTLFQVRAILAPGAAFVPSDSGTCKGPALEPVVLLIDAPTNHWEPYPQIVDALSSAEVAMMVFDFVFRSEIWSNTNASRGLLTSLSNAVIANPQVKLVFGVRGEKVAAGSLGQGPQLYPFDELRDFVEIYTNQCDVGLINNADPSEDGAVRIWRSELGFVSRTLGSVAAGMACTSHLPAPTEIFINYLGPPGTLVWTNQITKDALKSRTIFIGASGPDDAHRVPFTTWTGRLSSGAEIHATAFRNLVTRKANPGLVPAKDGVTAMAMAGAGVLVSLWFLRFLPARASVLLPMAAVPGLLAGLAAGVLFIKWSIVFPWWIVALPQTVAALLISLLPSKSVFISYKSEGGKIYARLFASAFRRLGIEVFLDEDYDQSGGVADYFANRIQERKNFVLLVTRELYSSSTLSNLDFRNPAAFLSRLKTSTDPVSTYLRAGLSSATVSALGDENNEPQTFALDRVVGDLNRIIREEFLFDDVRFAGVDLRQGTRPLLERRPRPEGEELAYLNRGLLEDAYPGAITRNDYWFVLDEIRTAQKSARNIVPVILDVEKWRLQAPGIVGGNEVEAWVRRRWELDSSLRIFRYDERTVREGIREIAHSLKWYPLRRLGFCSRRSQPPAA